MLSLVLAYFLGSIPFGLLLTQSFGMGDIRTIGSGNIGATNVLRTGNKKLALATLLLDAGKGALAVYLAHKLTPEDTTNALIPWLAGLAAILGHIFPIWLKGKGGKGVATSFAVLATLAWPIAISALFVWILIFALTRISSLAALSALLAASIGSFWLPLPQTACILTIAALVLWRHKENIERLMKKEEGKIKASDKK